MEAGRELDALVAERLGYEIKPGYAQCGFGHKTNYWFRIPSYSTSITAAWELVGKLRAQGLAVWVIGDQTGSLVCVGDYQGGYDLGDLTYRASGNTAPLAICLAFLKVTEVGDA